MIQRIFITVGLMVMTAFAIPSTPAYAACDNTFLTMPAWYRGLTEGAECNIKKPDNTKDGLRIFIAKIILNITEILLHLVTYASVLFIIIGGYRYMVALGESSNITAAKTIIRNALIGLVISIMSIAIVKLIFSAMGAG